MDKRTAYRLAKEYIEFLKNNNYDVKKAYIFGSYAKDTFNDDSDIDLAIILKNVTNSFNIQVTFMKLRRKFDTRIEPHPFDEKDFDSANPLVHEILKTGFKIM